MSAVTPELLRFYATLKARPGVPPHRISAMTARSFAELLSPGERWFLDMVAKLSRLSDQQQTQLNVIAAKVERGRK